MAYKNLHKYTQLLVSLQRQSYAHLKFGAEAENINLDLLYLQFNQRIQFS